MEHDASSIFDSCLRRKRRAGAAARGGDADFLKREAAHRLIDRLADIRRVFPQALDLGSHHGVVARLLAGNAQVGRCISADISPAMLAGAPPPAVACDEERLPFRDAAFDAVFSLLSLHAVNDLPGALIQCRRALKPDGLLLGLLPGASTLIELRECLAEAESALTGGVSPRVAPFVEVRDAGGLLQRAGFALPVVDREWVRVSYSSPFALMHELRAMGEANPLRARRKHFTPKRVMLEAARLYAERHSDGEGRVEASFEFLWVTAWAPDASQQQPLARGSGALPLGQALQ